MKLRIALASSAALVLLSSSALAADAGAKLSEKGNLVIAGERMFGYSHTVLTNETTVGNTKVSSTSTNDNFSLLWSYPVTVHNLPRIGLDYLVIPNLSLGLGAGFFSTGSKVKSTQGSTSTETDGPSINAWIIAPRVGYVLDLAETSSLWLRGGLSFYGSKTEDKDSSGNTTRTTTNTMSGTAFNLEPTFVWTPASHFGLYGGLALDVPLGGKMKRETTSVTTTGIGSVTTNTSSESDYTQASYGLTFGVLGYL